MAQIFIKLMTLQLQSAPLSRETGGGRGKEDIFLVFTRDNNIEQMNSFNDNSNREDGFTDRQLICKIPKTHLVNRDVDVIYKTAMN